MRYVAAPRLPIRYSVARTPVKNGFPTMPLYADDRAAMSNPSCFSWDPRAILNLSRIHAEIIGTRMLRVPSGPTLAPEMSVTMEEMNAPGKTR